MIEISRLNRKVVLELFDKDFIDDWLDALNNHVIRLDKPVGLSIIKKLGEGANATVRLVSKKANATNTIEGL